MNNKFKNKTILLFDGECNLCNSFVQFILKNEKNNEIQFSSLQSEIGKIILAQHNINTDSINSLVFIENNIPYLKSTAALKISRYLKGIYSLAILFFIIPKFMRDYIYDYIAKNRYNWYGKKDSCIVPTGKLLERFL
jgi:predicted DCC family thiol-disulfide oxidoreductase YuxK